MARRVYLHIGTMKAATTYLQALFDMNRAQLAEAGIWWPGGGRCQRAVEDLHDSPMRPPGAAGTWERLAEHVGRDEGDVLISMELLARSSPATIQRVAESLAPAELHVILTARELSRVLPSQWQEGAQNRRAAGWLEFVAQVCVDDPESNPIAQRIWTNHDLARIIDSWGVAAPPERTYLVTIPTSADDPSLVWRRVATVLGVEADRFELPGFTNESIGAVSAELMRRLHAGADLEWPVHRWAFRKVLAKEILSARADSEPRLTLPPERHAWVRARAERMMRDVEESKVAVIGDLAELLPPARPVGEGYDPDKAADKELLAAALSGLEGLGRRLTALRTEHDALTREHAELTRQRDALQRQLRDSGLIGGIRRVARRNRVARWGVHQLRQMRRTRPDAG